MEPSMKYFWKAFVIAVGAALGLLTVWILSVVLFFGAVITAVAP